MNNVFKKIEQNKVIAVLRGIEPEKALPAAEALVNGGVKTLEITADTPRIEELIAKLNTRFDDDVIIGAGTVLDAQSAENLIHAGAKFIFSPNVCTETIRVTKEKGVISIPGALTPTEIVEAYQGGADAVKVFPANALGPNYLKSIYGPLSHIPLVPTGGINQENMPSYFQKNVIAIGLGSSLVNANSINDQNNYIELTNKAKAFMAIVDRKGE
ncbi:ketohydroxyglutarate aldolase [Thalassobacillus devorans]|uniref:Ketohydroxyglutarate aldolase n=1 Tax=Thalassobacillus devorans TaxID=279813 RepID=A0ABQ1NSX5_9BACI|nr:bifunctional 4-hydroxy-2-oxoglutarate aldolase/2-dehydro-3-deoxy-phosphogluconate aldolase [Thalassobacillus devorans]NIK28646.1 2-dehydro-3-deoxyphosphogluconate aldolase/(4S)-4-hydroxy-2-oxoglutarate aldolase [Thalassobacillus devorans]GGC84614.1 ketohydroxyglutarate aldolase [Thalassobacillus devorans]